MRLYLARHGETEWNRMNRVLGRTDIPLNACGRKQAEQAADLLSGIALDRIYTSPLQRAVDTGQMIARRQKAGICMAEPCLIEQDFGIFEGTDRGDPLYQKAKRDYFSRYPGGESFFDVAARVYPFLYRLRDNGKTEEKVLLVTHGGICRIISNFFENMENEEFVSFTMSNCEIREFQL